MFGQTTRFVLPRIWEHKRGTYLPRLFFFDGTMPFFIVLAGSCSLHSSLARALDIAAPRSEPSAMFPEMMRRAPDIY